MLCYHSSKVGYTYSVTQAGTYYHTILGYSSVSPMTALTTLTMPGGGSITKQVAYTYVNNAPQSGLPASIQEWGFRNGTLWLWLSYSLAR